ncbi:MAG: gliding motility lipoprotein GldD [Prevotellaceae bacterium]|jgi:gliding motility-associated lipoprotein GldD|nr:gliding motility lipoprotein GldD [Prevotellaceae bacterium]
MKPTNCKRLAAAVVVGLWLWMAVSCGGGAGTPKPRGYIRIDFPEKEYHPFDSSGYPYRLACPAYGYVAPDTESYRYEPYWINIRMPRYKATVHISYKRVQKNLSGLLDDTHSFVYHHTIKADAIIETPFSHPEANVYGMLYEIGGNVASPVQFYATDSLRHFLRGSLYFFTPPNSDSLAPAIAFLTQDIEYLMQTIEWKKYD